MKRSRGIPPVFAVVLAAATGLGCYGIGLHNGVSNASQRKPQAVVSIGGYRGGWEQYQFKPGDCLWNIADKVADNNPHMISDNARDELVYLIRERNHLPASGSLAGVDSVWVPTFRPAQKTGL